MQYARIGRGLVVAAIVALIVGSSAQSQTLPQNHTTDSPPPKSSQQSDNANGIKKSSPKQEDVTAPSNVSINEVVSSKLDTASNVTNHSADNKRNHWFSDFLDAKITDYVIAIFTIFIAWFTLGLKNATINLESATNALVNDANITSKRQLRAYLCITKVSIVAANEYDTIFIDKDTGSPVIIRYGAKAISIVTCMNTGSTPAYNVTIDGNLKMVKWPIDDSILTIEERQDKSNEIIGANVYREKFDILDKNVSGEPILRLIGDDIKNLQQGRIALCAYGVIKYKDIFGRQHATYYRYFMGGAIGLRGTNMAAHVKGNYVEDTE